MRQDVGGWAGSKCMPGDGQEGGLCWQFGWVGRKEVQGKEEVRKEVCVGGGAKGGGRENRC